MHATGLIRASCARSCTSTPSIPPAPPGPGVPEALATSPPVLTRPDARDRPNPRELRTVLYQHAFNPARPAGPGSAAAQILDWAQQASLPVGCLSEPTVLRTALA